jgi:hypothetical protein
MTIGHAIAIAALDHDMMVPSRILLPHSINYAAIPIDIIQGVFKKSATTTNKYD